MMCEGGDSGQAAGGRSVLRDLTVQIFMLQVAVMLFAGIGSAAGATVAVITPATAEEGSTFSVTIQVQSVTDLYGAQFDLTFNPSVLEALSVSEGSFLKQGASTFWLSPTIDNVAGTIVDAAQVRLDVDYGVNGSGALATISFRAKATGTSSLNLGGILLSDSNGLPISSTSQPGSVTVQPPPPPPEAPDTQIISGPIGTIYTTTATFTWAGSDPDGFVASFDYMMDSGSWVTTTGTSATFTGLSKGDHFFYVRARDNDGLVDPTPASSPFTVYFAVNPETQIVSGPAGTVEGDVAAFEWIGTDFDGRVVSYLCRLDNATWEATNGTSRTYANLTYGNHTFQVKAVDDEGLEDPTPAERSFTLIPYWWEAEMDRLNRTIAQLEGQLQAAQSELEEAQAEMEEERGRLEGQMESLRAQVEALRGEKSDLESRNDDLAAKLEDLEEWADELEANATDLGLRLEESEEENLRMSREMDDLAGRLEERESQLEQAQAELEESRGAISTLEGQVVSLGNQTAVLQEQIRNLTAGMGDLEAEKDALEEWARAAEEEKAALQEAINRLESRLSSAEQRVDRAEEQMKEKQAELEALEAEKSAQDLRMAAVKETNQVLVRTRRALLGTLAAMAILTLVLLGLTIRYRRRVLQRMAW